MVDLDPRALKGVSSYGVDTLYGDAGDPDFIKVLPVHETKTVVCAAPDRSTNLVVLESLQQLGYGGNICLTALDRQTATTFESYERVTVVRPFQMAATSIVSGLKDRLDASRTSTENL